MQHFSEKHSVLILNLTKPFHVFHFFFVVVDDMIWFWWFSHINTWFYVAQSLDVHDVLFYLLTITDQPIGPVMVPHFKFKSSN